MMDDAILYSINLYIRYLYCVFIMTKMMIGTDDDDVNANGD